MSGMGGWVDESMLCNFFSLQEMVKAFQWQNHSECECEESNIGRIYLGPIFTAKAIIHTNTNIVSKSPPRT